MDDGIYTFQRMAKGLGLTIDKFPITTSVSFAGTLPPEAFHTHEGIEMALVRSGRGIHILNGRRSEIRAGDVLLIYPHVTHAYADCDTLELLNIIYAPDKLPMPLLDGEFLPLFRLFFPRDLDHPEFPNSSEPFLHIAECKKLEFVCEEFFLLMEELTCRQGGNMLLSLIRLQDILLSIMRFGHPLVEVMREQRRYRMGEILTYLNKNISRNIVVKDLIKMSHHSQSAFQYKFKNLTGYSVTEYILRKRIALAKELLCKNLDMPIGEVGFACGYLDTSYFVCSFRKFTGMTPRQYRRSKAP